jgi:hypothetical protein
MSHTLRKVNLGNTALAEITIVDYSQGGESFTLGEFGLANGLVGVIILSVQGSTLTPVFVAPNLIKLLLPITPDQEQPTTIGLNFTFVAIVNGT